jgi:hypothetical protein
MKRRGTGLDDCYISEYHIRRLAEIVADVRSEDTRDYDSDGNDLDSDNPFEASYTRRNHQF